MFSDSASAYLDQARLLLRILPLIRRYPDFALKGGTALNFYVRDLPRLSVDIDLTYLPIQPREESLGRITGDMEGLAASIERTIAGSRVTERRAGEGYIRGLLVRSGGVTVKIEPNHVIRGTVYPSSIRPLVKTAGDFFETEVDFPILSLPDLYAGKICAALDRQHPRDLFDVQYILKPDGLTDEVMKALLVYVISHPRPIPEVLSPRLQDIGESFEREFRFMARESMSVENMKDTRARLVDEVHRKLNPDDRAFLLSVKSGEPDWNLHPVEHVRNLPAVQWKLKNIRALAPAKHKEALEKLKRVLENGPA